MASRRRRASVVFWLATRSACAAARLVVRRLAELGAEAPVQALGAESEVEGSLRHAIARDGRCRKTYRAASRLVLCARHARLVELHERRALDVLRLPLLAISQAIVARGEGCIAIFRGVVFERQIKERGGL